jgi:ribosomal protein S17E
MSNEYIYEFSNEIEEGYKMIKCNISNDEMLRAIKLFENEMTEKYEDILKGDLFDLKYWDDFEDDGDDGQMSKILMLENLAKKDEFCDSWVIKEISMRIIKRYVPEFEWSDYIVKTDGDCFLSELCSW